MPTTSNVNVPSNLRKEGVIDLISNKGKADSIVTKLQSRNLPVFSPPSANPTCTGAYKIMAATKTKLKAKKKAVKEKKAQADKEKKLAVAACKLEAQAKKCKKAIALAEARAQKAAAKAKALRIQLASAKAANKTMRTPTGVRGAHVPKKSKGIGGEVALLTLTNLTTILSPQRKGSSPKKRVMLHSPLRLMANEVALSKEASSSGSFTSGSDKYDQNPLSSESESSSSLCSASSGRRVSAVFSGGRHHARSGRGRGGSRGPHPPCP
jgi:hypothetical protein